MAFEAFPSGIPFIQKQLGVVLRALFCSLAFFVERPNVKHNLAPQKIAIAEKIIVFSNRRVNDRKFCCRNCCRNWQTNRSDFFGARNQNRSISVFSNCCVSCLNLPFVNRHWLQPNPDFRVLSSAQTFNASLDAASCRQEIRTIQASDIVG